MFKISINICLDDIFWTTEPNCNQTGMAVWHYDHNPQCLANKFWNWVALFKVMVVVMADVIKIWLFLLYLLTSDHFVTCLMIQHHKLDCLVDYGKAAYSVVNVKVTAKVPNILQYLSGWYLLNYLTVCSQTESGKKIALLSSVSWSQWGLITLEYNSFYIFTAVHPLATRRSLMIHQHMLEYLVNIFDCCVQGQGYSDGSNLDWIFVVFCTTDIKAATHLLLGVWVYYY